MTFDDYEAVVWLSRSKTLKRKLGVVFPTQYLSAWLTEHPLKDDPESLLWIKLSGKNHLEPIDYYDIKNQLKRVVKMAGIKKEFIIICSGILGLQGCYLRFPRS